MIDALIEFPKLVKKWTRKINFFTKTLRTPIVCPPRLKADHFIWCSRFIGTNYLFPSDSTNILVKLIIVSPYHPTNLAFIRTKSWRGKGEFLSSYYRREHIIHSFIYLCNDKLLSRNPTFLFFNNSFSWGDKGHKAILKLL